MTYIIKELSVELGVDI